MTRNPVLPVVHERKVSSRGNTSSRAGSLEGEDFEELGRFRRALRICCRGKSAFRRARQSSAGATLILVIRSNSFGGGGGNRTRTDDLKSRFAGQSVHNRYERAWLYTLLHHYSERFCISELTISLRVGIRNTPITPRVQIITTVKTFGRSRIDNLLIHFLIQLDLS